MNGNLLIGLLWTAGCTGLESVPPPEDCELVSTVPSYTPHCSAVLALFASETRLEVDDRLEGFLPADVFPDTAYGGTSGRPLTVLLDGELAEDRDTTLTFGQNLAELRLLATFEAGTVEGWLYPEVVDSR